MLANTRQNFTRYPFTETLSFGLAVIEYNVIQAVLFANAAVQSLNLWIEAGKEFNKGNTKPLFGKLFRAAAHGVLIAALQAAIAYTGDDDDKKAYEQAPNWEKETYWIFGGLRIPKGFYFGMRFMANLTDETIGVAFDNKPFERKRFWDTFKGALQHLQTYERKTR